MVSQYTIRILKKYVTSISIILTSKKHLNIRRSSIIHNYGMEASPN